MKVQINVTSEFFFWLHFLLAPICLIAAWFVPPVVVLAGLILWYLQNKLFKGCGLTKFQKNKKMIPQNINFTQYFFKRLFNLDISQKLSAQLLWLLGGQCW